MKDPAQEESHSRLFHPAILIVVLAAVLLRLALSLYFPRVIKEDESMYLLLGHNLLSGNGFTYSGYPEVHFPPLHPIFLGLLYAMTGDWEMASNIEHAIFGGLLLLPIFAMASRIYGAQTAWLTTILLAVFPPLTVGVLYWASMSEPPFLFLLFLGLAVLLAALEDHRLWMFPASGVILGLAYLTRSEAIVFFAALSIFALVWLATDGRFFAARTWYAVGLFVVSFVLVAAPYVWYLHAHTGRWMISGKLEITLRASNHSQDGIALDRMYFSLDSSGTEINWLSKERFLGKGVTSLLAEPTTLLNKIIRNAGTLKENFFARTNFWWGLTPLVILGLFRQPWTLRRLRCEALLVTTLVALLVAFLPFGIVLRYFAPSHPVLLMWTARGAVELGQWCQDTLILSGGTSLASRAMKGVLGWFPAAVAVLALVLAIPVTAERAISATSFGNKEAGLWLKTHVADTGKVMSHDLAVALYGGRGWVPLPNTAWDRVMKYASTHGAEYLVVRDLWLEKDWPDLVPVVRNGASELELLHTFEEPHEPRKITTFVYRIKTPRT